MANVLRITEQFCLTKRKVMSTNERVSRYSDTSRVKGLTYENANAISNACTGSRTDGNQWMRDEDGRSAKGP